MVTSLPKGMPSDRRGQLADGGVVFGLADQPASSARRPGSYGENS
jgi:hypothetical protein